MSDPTTTHMVTTGVYDDADDEWFDDRPPNADPAGDKWESQRRLAPHERDLTPPRGQWDRGFWVPEGKTGHWVNGRWVLEDFPAN